MLTASVENTLVTSIDTTLETGVVPTQYLHRYHFDCPPTVESWYPTLDRRWSDC